MNDHPSSDDGFSVSFHWRRDGERRFARVPAGSWLRIAASVALCAASYKVGRVFGRLDAEVAAGSPSPARVAAAKLSPLKPVAEVPGATSAPGAALGEQQDVITPLNMRDPSALVMGPGATQAPPSAAIAEPPAPGEAPKDPPESPVPPKRYKRIQDIAPDHNRPGRF